MTDKEIMEALLRGETLGFDDDRVHSLFIGDDGNVYHTVTNLNLPWSSKAFNCGWRIKPKPKLTWDQALAAMREGRKVRRADWFVGEHLSISGGIFCSESGSPAAFCQAWFDVADWMLVE